MACSRRKSNQKVAFLVAEFKFKNDEVSALPSRQRRMHAPSLLGHVLIELLEGTAGSILRFCFMPYLSDRPGWGKSQRKENEDECS
jgi:hypothetical protein